MLFRSERPVLCASRCWFGMVFYIFVLMLLTVVVAAIVKLDCLPQGSLSVMWGWDAIRARGMFVVVVGGVACRRATYIYHCMGRIVTYDHRLKRIGHPVRSAIHKLEIGGLVVGWVTTSEYPLLYVFLFYFIFLHFLGESIDIAF